MHDGYVAAVCHLCTVHAAALLCVMRCMLHAVPGRQDRIEWHGTQHAACITSHATCHAARRVARYKRSTRRCAGGRLRMPTVCIAVCAAQVILGDRPVGITVKRLWAALSLWDKVRLLWTFLCEVTSPSLVPAKAHRQP